MSDEARYYSKSTQLGGTSTVSRPSPVVVHGDAPEDLPSPGSSSSSWLLGWLKGKCNRDTPVAVGAEDIHKRRNSPPGREKGTDPLWESKMPVVKPALLRCAPSENPGISTAPVSSCSSVLGGKVEVSWSPTDGSQSEVDRPVFFGPPVKVEADAQVEEKPREQLRVEATFTCAAEPIDIPPKKVEVINVIAFEAAQQSLRAMDARMLQCYERTRGASMRPRTGVTRPATTAAAQSHSVTLPVIYRGRSNRSPSPLWPGWPSFNDPSPSGCSGSERWFEDSRSAIEAQRSHDESFGEVCDSPSPKANDASDDLLFDLEDA